MQIRKVAETELDQVVQLARQSFYEAFFETNSPENLHAYINEYLTKDRFADEFSNPSSFFYLVWDECLPVAYLKLNTGDAQKEFADQNYLEIERIYVLKEWWGRGIGQQLLGFSIEVARGKKKEAVWLGVWEHNHRALRFYTRNGFTPVGSHLFVMGDDPQTDILMKKDLLLQ